MATLTLILTLLILLPVVTRIYLLNSGNALHRSVVLTGAILAVLGILEYEMANTTSLEMITDYARWHTTTSIFLLYSSSLIGYHFAAPYSEKWKKIGLSIAFLLLIPVVFIIYNLFFNGAILDTNHRLIDGQWQYEINKEGVTPKVFEIWSFIIVVYLSVSHFVAFYFAKKRIEKILKFALFLAFTLIPFWVIYQFILSVNVTDNGTYTITPYIIVILIVISWVYTNFKLFEISPVVAIDNILEAMSNAIIITDGDFKIKYVNDVTTFAEQKKDLLNKSMVDFMQTASNIPLELFEKIKNLKKEDKIIETFTFNFDNQESHLLTTVSTTYNQQNLRIGYVFAFVNLTETIETRNKLKAYSLQLEKSNGELERFAYIASHDMKAPLRNIISFLGLIERKLKNYDNKDVHEFINFASSNARYMHNLVQDILEYSKISKIDGELEIVDLNEILRSIKNDATEYILERNAIVNFEQLPVIRANKTQIYQLFQNLIENGIKYNESNIPKVNIKLVEKNDRLKIAFEDNGIGISEEFHEQIFDMFKRLHNNEVYQGTGIGLAICKKIMELHDGNIQVQSNEAKGMTFILDFPIN